MKLRKFKTVKGVLGGIQRLFANPMRWTQGSYNAIADDGDTCFCLKGAVYALAANRSVEQDVFDKLVSAVRAKSHRYTSIISFNDSPKRTIDSIRSVVALARKAA